MKLKRVEQQIITKSHPKFKIIDEMCYKSKNLYNYALYIIKQEYYKTHNYISYNTMNYNMKSEQCYKDVMSQPANSVLRVLDKNWKSFFKGLEQYNKYPNKFLGRPRPPKYLKKNGRFNWMIPNNTVRIENNNDLHFLMRKLNDYPWKCRNLGRLIQVRFVPKGTCYVMEIVYEVEKEVDLKEIKNVIGIDVGVNNLVTITNNIGKQPIIINGKPLKSINQFYNKQRAKFLSEVTKVNKEYWSNKLTTITNKRYRRIKDYIHKTTRYIINYCLENDIDTIIIGHNDKWKQNKSHKQNFIYIPYNMIISQLEYKCQDNNINFISTEESYTSGTSFLDNEEPVKDNYNKERRIVRGLFKSNNGVLINSDVNGSLQIIKKVIPNTFKDKSYGIGAYLMPIVINM